MKETHKNEYWMDGGKVREVGWISANEVIEGLDGE